MFRPLTIFLLGMSLASGVALAEGIQGKAKDAVDPNCTVGKAAKGAAMKATVGVGNRCGAAETARDVAGVDGKIKSTRIGISK